MFYNYEIVIQNYSLKEIVINLNSDNYRLFY